MEPHRLATAPALLLVLISGRAQAAPTVFVDEQAFFDAVAALPATGLVTVHEGFEDEPPWDQVRTTMFDGVHGAAGVTRAGLTWSSNHPDAVREPSLVTTSMGAARSGGWGLYATPHGNPDAVQLTAWLEDGFELASTGTLYAAGGWFTATAGASLVAIVDGAADSPSSLGSVDHTFVFFGVIESAGFYAIEFRETEGTREDQKFVWADDFTVVGFLVPEPPAVDAGPAPGQDASAAVDAADSVVTADATAPSDATSSTDAALLPPAAPDAATTADAALPPPAEVDAAVAADTPPLQRPDAGATGADDAYTQASAWPDTATQDGGAAGDAATDQTAASQDATGNEAGAVDASVSTEPPDTGDAARGDDGAEPADTGGRDGDAEAREDAGRTDDGSRGDDDRPAAERATGDSAGGCACDGANTPSLSGALGLALWILMLRGRRQRVPARSRRARRGRG